MKNIITILFIITILCFMAYIFHYYIGEKEYHYDDIQMTTKTNISKFTDIENYNKEIEKEINIHQNKLSSKLDELNHVLTDNDKKNTDIQNNIQQIRDVLKDNTSGINQSQLTFTSNIANFDKEIKNLIENKKGKVTICDNDNHCIEIEVNNNDAIINNYNIDSMNLYDNSQKRFVQFDIKNDGLIINEQNVETKLSEYNDKINNIDNNINNIINNPTNYNNIINKPILFDGDYNKLNKSPEWINSFDGSYNSLSNKPIIFDGDYTNLKHIPDHIYDFDGSYDGVKNKPEIFKSDLRKMQNKPNWVDSFDGTFGSIKNIPTFQNDIFNGNFNNLKNTPRWLKTFNGTYNSLQNKPYIFNGDFKELKDKPEIFDTSFDGSYETLKYKPNYFPSDFNIVKDKPSWFDKFDGSYQSLNDYDSLNDKPTLFDADYNKLRDIPEWMSMFNGNYNSLKNLPIVGSDDFNKLNNKPVWMSHFKGDKDTLRNIPNLPEFGGDYNKLKNKPKWLDEFDGSYDSLKHIPNKSNPNFDRMANKPSWFSSFDGTYNKLKNRPNIFPSDWNTTINKPLLRTGSKLPDDEKLISGNYNNGLEWIRRKGYQMYGNGDLIEQGVDVEVKDKFKSAGTSYNVEYNGYFFTDKYNGEFTFYTASDDESFLWIGDTKVVDNGGLHGVLQKSGKIVLKAKKYYPIKIQFGNNGGHGQLSVSFSHADIKQTTNGKGFYFHSLS